MNSQLDVGAGFSRPQSLPVALFLSDEYGFVEYGFNEPRRSEGSEGRKEEEEEEEESR